MKKWLRAQPDQPTTIADLQALLDAFVDDYNHHRPHRSLPHRATPATVYTSPPQGHDHRRPRRTTPTTASATTSVDKAGKITLRYHGQLYSIGIGRTHTGTRVIVLVQDLDIRIIDAATGELLRELTLDPPSATKAPDAHPAPPAENEGRPNPRLLGSAVRDVLRHHIGRADRI